MVNQQPKYVQFQVIFLNMNISTAEQTGMWIDKYGSLVVHIGSDFVICITNNYHFNQTTNYYIGTSSINMVFTRSFQDSSLEVVLQYTQLTSQFSHVLHTKKHHTPLNATSLDSNSIDKVPLLTYLYFFLAFHVVDKALTPQLTQAYSSNIWI